MGVLDKFLDIMKLSDDDDYEDDDFFDDDYDDDYEEKSQKKGSFFSRLKKEDDYEPQDDYEAPEDRPARKSAAQTGGKVTPMRQPARRQAANMEVCVIKPTSVEDEREIAETLLGGRTIILNLEGLDVEIAQRIIDFTSGATFAISGNLQKISNYIILVTPTNVEISGDLQDLLGSSFDSPAMGARY